MDKPTKNESCKTCSHFDNYYIKGNVKFEQTNYGYCCKQQKIIENSHCEQWRKNFNYNSPRRKAAAASSLRKILTHLSALRQIFEESAAEEKQNKSEPRQKPDK